MKVVKEGKWIEECKFCNSLIELEVTDLYFVGKWKEYKDDNKVGFDCPVCKNTNVLKKTRVTRNVYDIVSKKYDWDHY